MGIPKGYCQCGCGGKAPIATQTGRKNIKGEPVEFLKGHQLRIFPPEEYKIEINPSGLCQCGCGQPTLIANTTDRRKNLIKGQPKNFIKGHAPRNQKRGEDSYMWKGGRCETLGYIKIHAPEHPKADANRRVFEHILVAEKALGKILPLGAVVHHVNEDGSDNRPNNLVICQDVAYHFLLHQRKRAYEACGHASWRKCRYCKTYDSPNNLFVPAWHGGPYHHKCHNEYQKSWRRSQN